MAYYQLEPFGEERDDLRAGIVASTIANANRNPKKRARPFQAKEFMPRFDEEREPQSWEEQLHIVEMWNAALGGRDLRSRK
jgi:flagellar basal body rod protein FlgC